VRAELVGIRRALPAHLDRDLDLRGVAPDGLAVLREDAELAVESLDVAEAVPDVGVLRDDAEGLLLAPAAAVGNASLPVLPSLNPSWQFKSGRGQSPSMHGPTSGGTALNSK
jgi:hypothetical protein